MDKTFWKNKKVFITGNTGFKGSWLTFWLNRLEASVVGYSLRPDTEPALFNILGLENKVQTYYGDVRDFEHFHAVLTDFQPEIILHLAAQPLVREAYLNPTVTVDVNVTGTSNLLAIAKKLSSVKSLVNVTTDKCYLNVEQIWSYRETDPLGGHDPYSASKACSEIITQSYYKSFFSEDDKLAGVASARAGNVIGGGDWSKDRIITDILNAQNTGDVLQLRSPNATRPWQHVFEPLYGYLLLAQRLFEDKHKYSGAWNFGPNENDIVSVSKLLEVYSTLSDRSIMWRTPHASDFHEAELLSLDTTKAKKYLEWAPRFNFEQALAYTEEWYRAYDMGHQMSEICSEQLDRYEKLIGYL
ncbi:CDP-glucose 4,6-dehydratase [Paracoccaceae bacterium]|nr:CDP-glucose 4,6-dehydratase [Paracoccaceae bacterium]